MSLEVIYVTRHGFRSPWVVDPTTGSYSASFRSPTGLPTDPALTSHGVEQAAELADHLATLRPPIDQVYSSPYYRCLQTVEPFVSRRKLLLRDGLGASSFALRADEGLSEWYGLAHFEHPTSAPLSELQTFFPHLEAGYTSAIAPPRNGESIAQLHDRVAACAQAIVTQCDREGKRALLICSHAAVVIALGRALTGLVPEDARTADFGAHTCGLSIYRRRRIEEDTRAAGASDRMQRANQDPQAGSGLETRAPAGQHPLDSWDGKPGQAWKSGPDAFGGWTCEVNSDCSFLRCGEERGW
ncbi:histidine phosphatase superfamily [Xylariaceae sp. FL0804]|nr:histidine phosphatase superfamily [Xylariaceae sp. FL0804]